MSKKHLIFVIITGMILSSSLVAGYRWLSSRDEVDIQSVSTANSLYEAGHYEEAAKIYTQLVAQDVQSSTVYFNLGNTYYQQGDLGRAILNYQRAAHLDPRDKDIQFNLAIARESAFDIYPQEPGGPAKLVAGLTGNWLTPNETAWLLLSLWFLLGFLILLRELLHSGFARSGVQFILILAVVIFFIGGISLGSRIYLELMQPDGVIVAPVVAVSSTPNAEESSDFQLHSGTQVQVIETFGDWIQLDLPGDDGDGWIPQDAIELIALNGAINNTL